MEHQYLLFWLVTFPFHIIHAIVRIVTDRYLEKKCVMGPGVTSGSILFSAKVHDNESPVVHTHTKQVYNKVQNSQ